MLTNLRPGWLACGLLAGNVATAAPITLENAYVRVTVDPARGGAVTAMDNRQAMRFDYIAGRGAGVAGSGAFFVPLVKLGETTHELARIPLQPELQRGAEQRLALRGEVAPGLTVERVIRLGAEESGLRLSDTYRNTGATELLVALGARSWQQPEAWRMSQLRSYFGDADRAAFSRAPYDTRNGEAVAKVETKGAAAYWRLIGQYGTGLLYQVTAPRGPVAMENRIPKQPGCAVEQSWLCPAVAIAPGQSVTAESSVLIDEFGREGHGLVAGRPSPALVAVDLRRAGVDGQPMPAAVSAVSATPLQGKLVVRQWYQATQQDKPVIAQYEVALRPGRPVKHTFTATPPPGGKGYFAIEATLYDATGGALAHNNNWAIINGQDEKSGAKQYWDIWTRRLPEVRLQGTWQEIGAQLAALKLVKPSGKPEPAARADLAFYEQRFPYYADLLKGAAAALNTDVLRLARASAAPAAPAGTACMGTFFDGPDGPILGYSKERGGSSVEGMAYTRIIPDQGYPLHLYALNRWDFGYGINAAGLATAGATINCDAATEEAARTHRQGRRLAPLSLVMMLAMCRDVDEAIAFIEQPDALFDFTGNMLLCDRAGNAAILESVATMHQIIRRPVGQPGVFASGNYSHERPDGRFKIGPDEGYAANTMCREQFLTQQLAATGGQASLARVFELMETHDLPGGMCQHTFENPGSLYSTASTIAVTRTGELYIANGPPCSAEYVRYSLRD